MDEEGIFHCRFYLALLGASPIGLRLFPLGQLLSSLMDPSKCVNEPSLPQQENQCYMLGTDFKAGQTKFKTAAVEYIRSLGMCPKVRSICRQ